jgi:sulfur-oxidizing protein SoxX
MRTHLIVSSMLAGIVAAGCTAVADPEATRAAAEDAVSHAYPGMPQVLTARAIQDRSQKLCSKTNGQKLTTDEALQIVDMARTSLKYPSSGKLLGDWKIGAQLVMNGAGMRVREGRVEKTRENGALCTNCHALDPTEVNAGNLGPSLTGYGTQRGNSEAIVKHTYEKIYNAWLYYPCSNMPRMGHNGYLTPEQITHLVAYLVDPQSPVNRK